MMPAHKALKTLLDETFSVFERSVVQHRPGLQLREMGTVQFLGHGMARVHGLPSVQSEELVRFPGGLLGMVFNVDPAEVGVILLDHSGELRAGAEVRRTGRVLDVPVGEVLLGRIVDATGRPLDDRGPVDAVHRRPIEQEAPAIMDRAPVTVPLHTGLKVVDALIPIGRGQREIILGVAPTERTVAAVGVRLAARLAEAGQQVAVCFAVPSALAGVTPVVRDMLLHLEAWYTQQQLERIYLFYSQPLAGVASRPHTVHLLPINQAWLTTLLTEAWPTRVLPTFTMDWERLFAALMRQYFFVSLHRACVESLASENASRLAAMQGAEKNIADRLAELQAQFRQQRQTAITAELLDMVAGFEALTQPAP